MHDLFSVTYLGVKSSPHQFSCRCKSNDGNKRTSFQVLDIILDLNGIQVLWDVEVVGQKIIQVSQSLLDEEDFMIWLRRAAL
jgi:prophage maintenance system killer protein